MVKDDGTDDGNRGRMQQGVLCQWTDQDLISERPDAVKGELHTMHCKSIRDVCMDTPRRVRARSRIKYLGIEGVRKKSASHPLK